MMVTEREEAEDAEKDAQATWTQYRWCSPQHDPAVDTIAKRLARGAGLAVMTCAGCGDSIAFEQESE